jgi:glucan 1,3-beta-glucosidase
LNTSWRWGTDRVYGYVISIGWSSRVDISISSVNLGGWFVLEPFISPALFEKYPTAIDEWTLSEAMRADTAGGGIDQLDHHYDTFIVSFFISSHGIL